MTSRVLQRLFCGPATGHCRRSWQWLAGAHHQSSPLTISGSSLSQVERLASCRPISPKCVAPSRVQETLPAEGTRGGSLGHEPLRVRSGKRMVLLGAPSFPKWSQTKVGGDRRSISPLLSLAWDPDVVVARVLDPLAHSGPLGEGQAACDITEHQASPATTHERLGACYYTPLSLSFIHGT